VGFPNCNHTVVNSEKFSRRQELRFPEAENLQMTGASRLVASLLEPTFFSFPALLHPSPASSESVQGTRRAETDSDCSRDERRRGVIAAYAGTTHRGWSITRQSAVKGKSCIDVDDSARESVRTRGLRRRKYPAGANTTKHARRLCTTVKEQKLNVHSSFDDEAVIPGKERWESTNARAAGDLDIRIISVGGGGLIAALPAR